MTPEVYKYPLDLTGEAISNRVEKESKTVTDAIITLNAGVFYEKGLIVKLEGTETPLVIKKDFILNYLHEEATVRSGCGTYAIIVLINDDIRGDLQITYQAVGGEYTKLDDAILKAIGDINESDTVVTWGSIINKPLTYPAKAHVHIADDIVGTEDIVGAIDTVAAAIRGELPEDIIEINKKLDTKVSNSNFKRISQVENQWTLSDDKPLRISVKPFPSAIVVNIDIWQADSGYSNLEVSGELSFDGNWLHRNYLITRGKIPNIEIQMIAIDGASAEILIKITKTVDIFITPNVVTYLKHKPEVTSISCIDLSTTTAPIPDEYEIPKVAWI